MVNFMKFSCDFYFNEFSNDLAKYCRFFFSSIYLAKCYNKEEKINENLSLKHFLVGCDGPASKPMLKPNKLLIRSRGTSERCDYTMKVRRRRAKSDHTHSPVSNRQQLSEKCLEVERLM